MLQQHSMSRPQCCPIYGWLGIVLSVGTSTDIVGTTVWRLVSVCSAIYRLEAPTAISLATPHCGNWVAVAQCAQCRWHFHLPLCQSVAPALCTAVWEFGVTHSPCHRSLFSPCETSTNSKFWPNLPSKLSWDPHMCQMSPNAEFITGLAFFKKVQPRICHQVPTCQCQTQKQLKRDFSKLENTFLQEWKQFFFSFWGWFL